jgi:hypothetical protein
VKENRQLWLPILLMLTFALTRWPGLLPPNFSAAYALTFCAGVFLPKKLAWWLPLGTMLASDLIINLYYQFVQHIDAFKWTQLINYAVYAVLILLGTRFNPRAALLKLIGGGVLGAIIFYVITNTASWFFNPFNNPEYTKTFAGWIVALTKGTAGYPQTWEFFRNTFLSGGLFTGLFAGAMKLSEVAETQTEEQPEEEEKPEQPQETKA